MLESDVVSFGGTRLPSLDSREKGQPGVVEEDITDVAKEKEISIAVDEGLHTRMTKPSSRNDQVHDVDANPSDSKQTLATMEVHLETAAVPLGITPTGHERVPSGHEQTEPTDLAMTPVSQNPSPPRPTTSAL